MVINEVKAEAAGDCSWPVHLMGERGLTDVTIVPSLFRSVAPAASPARPAPWPRGSSQRRYGHVEPQRLGQPPYLPPLLVPAVDRRNHALRCNDQADPVRMNCWQARRPYGSME